MASLRTPSGWRFYLSLFLLACVWICGAEEAGASAVLALPRLYFDDPNASVSETPGGTNLVFTVRLSAPSSSTVTVDYSVTDFTATAWMDFIPTNGTLVFPPGTLWQQFTIAILDDQVYEGYESMRVNFSNPINAELSSMNPGQALIVDNELAPSLGVSDAILLEGDSGSRDAVFTVSLSGVASFPLAVWFTTEDGTANAGADYAATAVYLIFPPGTTNLTVAVPVFGDLINEGNETFLVHLSTSAGIVMAKGQGVGTILNDDAVPGRFDHFAWGQIPTLQATNRPFPVTLSAVDAFGMVVSSYIGGAVPLTSVFASAPRNLLFAPRVSGDFVAGIWSGWVTVSNTAPSVSLRADDGLGHIGASNPFNVDAQWPVWITAPQGVNEGDGELAGQGRVLTPYPVDHDVIVSLSSSDTTMLRVPPSVIIAAGETSAVFTITAMDDTLLNGSRTVWITPSALNYDPIPETVEVHDNEAAVLFVSMPPSVTEGQGTLENQGTVTLSAIPDADVSVHLSASDTTAVIVFPSVIIPAGQTSAVFNLTIPDDALINGPRSVAVTAHVENWTDGVGTTIVQDNETTQIVLNLEYPGPLHEGLHPLTNALRLRLGGTLTTNLTVNLVSSDPGEAIVPPTVVVPAGRTSTYVTLTVVDDTEIDGTQPVTITASAPGFGAAALSLAIEDNDVHHFAFAIIPTLQTSSVPFHVATTAMDVNGVAITSYEGTNFTLSALGDAVELSAEPKQPNELRFVHGLLSGFVTIPGWSQTNVRVIVQTPDGATGQSNPFRLIPPTWTSNLRLDRLRIIGPDVVIEFDTVADFHYLLERTAELTSQPWVPVGQALHGVGAVATITDTNGAKAPARFYRLQVGP